MSSQIQLTIRCLPEDYDPPMPRRLHFRKLVKPNRVDNAPFHQLNATHRQVGKRG